MISRKVSILTIAFILTIFCLSTAAQSDDRTQKKNARPTDENSSQTKAVNDQKTTPQNKAAFVYEFSQPQFTISTIRIEHDETGKGKISFRKKDFDDDYTDPIQLTPVTLQKLNEHFDKLNFLESSESYQYEKDYSHLGNMKFKLSKNGRERTAAFNWTTNPDAKAIADEYRKISNQFIWMFDISVARENQPLDAPRLMKALDSYLKRGEISDPSQMISFLKDLSVDERIPLIARNNAIKLIKDIEKK